MRLCALLVGQIKEEEIAKACCICVANIDQHCASPLQLYITFLYKTFFASPLKFSCHFVIFYFIYIYQFLYYERGKQYSLFGRYIYNTSSGLILSLSLSLSLFPFYLPFCYLFFYNLSILFFVASLQIIK